MPIHCPVSVKNLSADEFTELDYRIMGHACASQNELGRLCDERVYHADLRARLLSEGLQPALTEVPVTVSHRDFSNKYFLDLLVGDALYELKTHTALVADHDSQLFNYMFLLGIQRAKLLNFRPSKIQGKMLATSLTHTARHNLNMLDANWIALTPACQNLKHTLRDLLHDWGAFLEVSLYQEALIHLFGGQAVVEQRVSLKRHDIPLGTQPMLTHAPGVAFRVTAVTEGQRQVESHLRRLLALTDLQAIQWINLNHAKIEFTTISRKAEE